MVYKGLCETFFISCLLEEWPDIWRNAYFRDRKCVRIPRVGKWKREKIVFSWRITAVVSLRLHICLTTCENLGLGNQYLRELVWRKLKNVLCETRLCTVQVCMYVNKKTSLSYSAAPFTSQLNIFWPIQIQRVWDCSMSECGGLVHIIVCLAIAGMCPWGPLYSWDKSTAILYMYIV